MLPFRISGLELIPPPDSPLLEAVKKGDVQEAESILAQWPSEFRKSEIDQRGNSGNPALKIAAAGGHLELVKLLVENGATIDIGKENGDRTPLIEASDSGHADIAAYLISKGADVNALGNGVTPLMAAVSTNAMATGPAEPREETIRLLLEKGADVNVQDNTWLKTGFSPLMMAVRQADAALVQTLLAKQADLNLKSADGETALDMAKKDRLEYITRLLEASAAGKRSGPPDEELHPLFDAAKQGRLDEVRSLVENGADVHLRTPNGSTPLMFAADGGSLETTLFLIAAGSEVNAANGSNNTALIFAAIKGNDAVAQALLSAKADVNAGNVNGGDPLVYAVMGKMPKTVAVLLKNGAGTDGRYDEGETVLTLAVNAGNPEIVQLLIDAKADVNAVNQDEMTPLMIAARKGDAPIVEALLKAGADLSLKSASGDTALIQAISENHTGVAERLVKHGKDFDRHEALSAAVHAEDLHLVKLLLTKGFDVNTPGFSGETLLIDAADGDFSIVKFLVESGAEINKKDNEGNTALIRAVQSWHDTRMSSISFLVDRGADVNAVNNKGESALILAAKRENSEIAALLTEKGSNVRLKDGSGKSAWTYAVEGGNQPMIKLLENAGAAKDYTGMVWEGNQSGQREKFIKIVDTPEEWTSLWMRAFDRSPPEIDFQNHAAACVFLGHSAGWLFSIGIGEPFVRESQLVVPYGLHEVMLRLSGPFKAGGQYSIRIFEKRPGLEMTIEEISPTFFGER